jgi:hypothetical protein
LLGGGRAAHDREIASTQANPTAIFVAIARLAMSGKAPPWVFIEGVLPR